MVLFVCALFRGTEGTSQIYFLFLEGYAGKKIFISHSFNSYLMSFLCRCLFLVKSRFQKTC
jgi:hypothetical protein